MVVARRAGMVVGIALALVFAACGGEEVETIGHDCPPADCPDDDLEDDHEPPPLTPEQLERYYVAQVSWRDCAMGEGLALTEPPSLEEFAAGGGEWWVGAEISDDDWNRLIVGDESGNGGVGRRCGEPPLADEFLVGRDALERLYAWQVEVVACLEGEGFPLDTSAPPLEEFIETGGTAWVPAKEFHGRYGFPEGAPWTRIATRCGNLDQDLWLEATDFEVDRAALEAQYEENLALTACLEEASFAVPEPPSLDEFVDQLGWNWTNTGIWGAVYRDNDRGAVRAFADRIDQVCPEVS